MDGLFRRLKEELEALDAAVTELFFDEKYVWSGYHQLPGGRMIHEEGDSDIELLETYEEKSWLPVLAKPIEEAEEPQQEGLKQEGNPFIEPRPARNSFHVPYSGFEVHRVPRYHLGYHVLGRAFPYLGVVEIASDLYGEEFQEVLMHETLHMRHPEKTEGEIRRLTRELLPFGSKWN